MALSREQKQDARERRFVYLSEHTACEYSLAAGSHLDFFDWAGTPYNRRHKFVMAMEVDHIWGRRGPLDAVEHPSNYMAAHTVPHKWKTDNDCDGRILALCWKWRRRLDEPDGWDLERMQQVFGQRPLGWMENQLENKHVPAWLQAMAEEVLRDTRVQEYPGPRVKGDN